MRPATVFSVLASEVDTPFPEIFLFVAALAIALGYVPAWWAQQKGYSLKLFWILSTFFLLPMAIIAVLLPERDDA